MTESIASLLNECKACVRSLLRAKGFTITVAVTLALGIGANAAIFSLVRGVLLRPLVNRGEDRLIFIEQTSGGHDVAFSIPELVDLRSRAKTLSAIGDFSAVVLTLTGLGEPRSLQAGVVGVSYFEVMGLRPVLGRLLDARDDGESAAGAVVLTYRFWSTALKSDPTVIGKAVRLDSFVDARPATIVGVLEPCVPYPQETEIIGNVVTSAHHLSATMVTSRLHRMTYLFGRLASGQTVESARAELHAVHDSMKREHPGDYEARADYRIRAMLLRDQLTAGARTILLVLMVASLLVFVIACSNVANLILARTLRRQAELGIRVALGASSAALRRTLLIESLMLCIGGAAIGLLIADPLLSILTGYISRFSVRALELKVDSSVLWVGAALAVIAAGLLAFVPHLPSSGGMQGIGLAGSGRVTRAANRKQKIFAVVQIAASFVLVVAAGAAMKTLLALQSAHTGLDMDHVLAINLPVVHEGRTPTQTVDFYREAARQIRELPGVQGVSVGTIIPWRDAENAVSLRFGDDGHVPGPNEEYRHAMLRIVSPGFFATLGVPILEGRDFTDADRDGSELVAIISQSLAQRAFPNGDALNHHVRWTDPILQAVPMMSTEPLRVVSVVPDIDDVNPLPKPNMTIYRPFAQESGIGGGRLFVHARSNPYGLVMPITGIMRHLSASQPVERAATLEDVRAEVLSPERLNVMVAGVFAGVALLIAVVGVAGVLAFSVSGRTREFGIRLAVGSQPRHLLMRVIAEGAGMAIAGLVVGFGCGFWLAQLGISLIGELQMPDVLPVAGSALILLIAAVTASAIPAARAARIDVVQALRTE
jgi:predicted permease